MPNMLNKVPTSNGRPRCCSFPSMRPINPLPPSQIPTPSNRPPPPETDPSPTAKGKQRQKTSRRPVRPSHHASERIYVVSAPLVSSLSWTAAIENTLLTNARTPTHTPDLIGPMARVEKNQDKDHPLNSRHDHTHTHTYSPPFPDCSSTPRDRTRPQTPRRPTSRTSPTASPTP